MFSRSLLLFVTAAALSLVSSTKLTLHSFEPPFKDVDGAGDRMINKYWRSSGHTVVHSNFIRLTPDRQSKRGAIWSTKPLGVDSWSGLLSFRISGQGKTLFGDGIALWITHSAFHNAGELHGSQEKFVGVGIIFDTFRNSENSAVHRDITILVNDGTQTYESMAKASVGCDSNFRFHADRADFSVSNAARAKILVEEGRVGIAMDLTGSGEYIDCAIVDNPALPKDWLRKAHVGITATTGALADNHDIISLQSFSDFEVLENYDVENANSKLFEAGPANDLQGRMKRVEKAIDELMNKNKVREHHIEHAFAAVEDHLKTMIDKIERREDKSDTRIQDLEEKIKKQVAGSIDTRVSRLEWQLTGKVQKKVEGFGEDFVAQFGSKIEESQESNQSWRTPFYILLGLLLLGGIGLVFFYRKLVSHHIL